MTLGSVIAKARKDAGLSIEELANVTNLRPTLLREIEKDDFSHCGGDTYARGHVRNMAKNLKADEKEFLRLYDEEQSIEKRTMKDLLIEYNVMRQPNEARKVSWKVLVAISVASLGIVGIAQITISRTSTLETITPAVTSTPSPSPSPTLSESPSPSPTPALSESPTQSPSAEPSAQSSFSTGTGVEVVVNALRAKTWLFVSDASGRTLFSGLMSKGTSRIFTSDVRLDLKVGNAGGVDVQVNGKIGVPIGGNGEVVSVSYGADS